MWSPSPQAINTVSPWCADTTAPAVTVTCPQDNATYPKDLAVKANFSASDDGSGLASVVPALPTAVAPVLLDTSTPGPHMFTVTATDYAGNKTVVQRTYTVRDRTPGTVVAWGDNT